MREETVRDPWEWQRQGTQPRRPSRGQVSLLEKMTVTLESKDGCHVEGGKEGLRTGPAGRPFRAARAQYPGLRSCRRGQAAAER